MQEKVFLNHLDVLVLTSEIELTITDLERVDFAREDIYGNKACHLSRLISRGYNVPRGIVISTSALA